MNTYEVDVKFTGCIDYEVTNPGSETEAMRIAQNISAEETHLGELSDIDWEVKSASRFDDDYLVSVCFTGKIGYEVQAESRDEAIRLGNRKSAEETRIGSLSDVTWEVKYAELAD